MAEGLYESRRTVGRESRVDYRSGLRGSWGADGIRRGHRPAVHQLEVAGKPATRYVLGDWKPKLWWLEANEGGLTLHNRDFG